ARRVAEIDLLASFAHLAALRGWVRPQVEDSGILEFVAARHPVVERRMEESGGGRFVPNSISLEAWFGGDTSLVLEERPGVPAPQVSGARLRGGDTSAVSETRPEAPGSVTGAS